MDDGGRGDCRPSRRVEGWVREELGGEDGGEPCPIERDRPDDAALNTTLRDRVGALLVDGNGLDIRGELVRGGKAGSTNVVRPLERVTGLGRVAAGGEKRPESSSSSATTRPCSAASVGRSTCCECRVSAASEPASACAVAARADSLDASNS